MDPKACRRCGTPVDAEYAGGLCPACLLKDGLAGRAAPALPRLPRHPRRRRALLRPLRGAGPGGAGGAGRQRPRRAGGEAPVAVPHRPPAGPRRDGIGLPRPRPDPRPRGRDQGRQDRHLRARDPGPPAPRGADGRAPRPIPTSSPSTPSATWRACRTSSWATCAGSRWPLACAATASCTEDEARRILADLAEALDHAHRQGVVHRDVKPDNVLLDDESGRALLTDFGVAKALGGGETMTATGSVVGTPSYMSPEQAAGRADIDGRSDIYSLGVMGYAMLSGRLPFEGKTAGDVLAKHLTQEPPPLRALAPALSDSTVQAVERCLAKDPARRWPDARSLKHALGVTEEPAAAGHRPGRRRPGRAVHDHPRIRRGRPEGCRERPTSSRHPGRPARSGRDRLRLRDLPAAGAKACPSRETQRVDLEGALVVAALVPAQPAPAAAMSGTACPAACGRLAGCRW